MRDVTRMRDADGDYGQALVALARIRARRAGHPSAGTAATVGRSDRPGSARPAFGAVHRHGGADVVSLTAYRARRGAGRAQVVDAAAWRSAR